MSDTKFSDFVSYCRKHIKGDEKGEAQIFLERFFVALGYADGLKGAGAECEFRIKNEKKKSTSFADLVWKPRVLIEMKKRGEDLTFHYQQAFSYWMQLVPHRPQYVVLCNFDEIWIYDFDKNIYEPLDKINLVDLDKHKEAFSFLLPQPKKPVFSADREDVTTKAAERVAAVFKSLCKRGINREDALRYCLQCIVSMFAEDIDLLPDKIFTRLIEECNEEQRNSFDLIGGLFEQMNKPGITPAGKYKDVDYFNGGLFDKIIPLELLDYEIEMLQGASFQNWQTVNPAIFGTIFEKSLEETERHILGAHYTYETDIKKIIDPVIVQPWKRKIDAAENLNEYYLLIRELRNYKVLDAACGSGNFLFIAYKELKLIERELINIIQEKSTSREQAKVFGKFMLEPFVSTKQFYGIDIKPFAVELAKVTLMVAKELSLLQQFKKDFDTHDAPLPLDNLDQNIICADALFITWPEVDVIIGNPPFQSKNKMQDEFGLEYMNKLRKAFPEVPGRADFCVYWFYKAHKQLKKNTYAGLVGTNTIRQNYSREGSLDFIVNNGGEIMNAYSTMPWSGAAAVHVSIVCWKNGKAKEEKLLFTINDKNEFVKHEVTKINSSLSLKPDVTGAKILVCNKKPKKVFQGQTHGHEGFLLSLAEGKKLLNVHSEYNEVLKPFLIGDELVGAKNAQPARFVIDFTLYDVLKAASYKELYKIVEKKVLPERKERAEKQEVVNIEAIKKNKKAKVNKHHINFYKNWWKLSYGREDFLNELKINKRFIACARVTQRPIFEFFDCDIRPNDKVMAFCFDDDYSFGIIQSNAHWLWFLEKCTTLGETPNYNTAAIWDTFPWPQNPTVTQIENVAKASKALRDARNKAMKDYNYSFRDLYRILEKPGKNEINDLQNELNEAVIDAYNFDAVFTTYEVVKTKNKKTEYSSDSKIDSNEFLPYDEFAQPNLDDNNPSIDEFHEPIAVYKKIKKQLQPFEILEKLLELNLWIAERELNGENIQTPGLPDIIKSKKKFVSDDCVKFEI